MGKNFGTILVPEGLVEFVPEVLMMDQGTRARGLY